MIGYIIISKMKLLFTILFGLSLALTAKANFCNHALGSQQKKLAEFKTQHPAFEKDFKCRTARGLSPINPEGKFLTPQILPEVLDDAYHGYRTAILSFALIKGETTLRLGNSHQIITGGHRAITAGEIMLIFADDSADVKEVWLNSKAGGYFGNSPISVGAPLKQEDTITTLPAAIEALWANGIFPERIKIFYFDAKSDDDEIKSLFAKPALEL